MKKKIKRFVPTLLVMLILANTMAYAGNQLYSFDLPTGAARYTDVITKDTSNTSAKIYRSGPSGTTSTIRFTVVNPDTITKSTTDTIKGIGNISLTYIGANKSDLLRLKVQNYAPDNSGASTSASGRWEP